MPFLATCRRSTYTYFFLCKFSSIFCWIDIFSWFGLWPSFFMNFVGFGPSSFHPFLQYNRSNGKGEASNASVLLIKFCRYYESRILGVQCASLVGILWTKREHKYILQACHRS